MPNETSQHIENLIHKWQSVGKTLTDLQGKHEELDSDGNKTGRPAMELLYPLVNLGGGPGGGLPDLDKELLSWRAEIEEVLRETDGLFAQRELAEWFDRFRLVTVWNNPPLRGTYLYTSCLQDIDQILALLVDMTLRGRVKQRMEAKGDTQESLASDLHCDRATISRFLRGEQEPHAPLRADLETYAVGQTKQEDS